MNPSTKVHLFVLGRQDTKQLLEGIVDPRLILH